MNYLKIKDHYEQCLAKHGPNHKGMDWPNEKDLALRFQIMIGIMHRYEGSLLDIGCGVGLMLDDLPLAIDYTGIDISPKMIKAAKIKYPNDTFICQNILKEPLTPKSFDWVVMNGVLTEKVSLSQKEMINFTKKMISAAFDTCRKGVAFNVMSKHVDWERDDLFHYPFDEMYSFVQNLSRHVIVRADYGLYEYAVYIYREPNE